MPVYKDQQRNSWYCKFSYQDWTGQRRQKLKRGFSTKREAAAWERDFLETQQGSPDMTFQALYNLYVEDISHRLKKSTVQTKRYICERRIVPDFASKPISQITPADVRKWQNGIISSKVKETYQRQLHSQLNAIFNFAVKYYGLPRNPCSVTGSIGKLKADRMNFWTLEEFKSFIAQVPDLTLHTAFMTLYYAGLRCGELLALNIGDIDLQDNIISVNKTYHRYNATDLITSPKTPGSIRKITMPPFLADCLKDYINHIYKAAPEDRLFITTRCKLTTALKKPALLPVSN